MTTIDLVEYGPRLSVRLDDATARALVASRIVEVAPDPRRSGHWSVRAQGKVGVVRLSAPGGASVTLRIAPKVPIARLLFLLGYHLSPKGWRDEEVGLREETELLPAFARLFARQAERALRQGLLQGYHAKEETARFLRGRIREADQIRRQHGRPMPLEIVHDEYGPDIAENRLLLAACERLLRLPDVPRDARPSLLRMRVRLSEIEPSANEPLTWRPTRLNARYHQALYLAELVLRGTSVEHQAGDVTVNGFLFDMSSVFEDFVTTALCRALSDRAGHCVLQVSVHLDEARAIRMIPDFVRYADDGTPLAVADAKYKAEKRAGFPDADIYQMLAYCTALGLPEGHLIYAKGNAPHTAHHVRRSGVIIRQHALELDQPPAGLLAEINELASLIASAVPA